MQMRKKNTRFSANASNEIHCVQLRTLKSINYGIISRGTAGIGQKKGKSWRNLKFCQSLLSSILIPVVPLIISDMVRICSNITMQVLHPLTLQLLATGKYKFFAALQALLRRGGNPGKRSISPLGPSFPDSHDLRLDLGWVGDKFSKHANSFY